jgi:hypothetical protein
LCLAICSLEFEVGLFSVSATDQSSVLSAEELMNKSKLAGDRFELLGVSWAFPIPSSTSKGVSEVGK